MADESLPPLEIPWTLAATTQPLAPFEPADNAISIFWYLPDDKALTSEFPNDRLVYLKFAVTVSPAPVPPGVPFPAGFALGDRIPCFHLRLDLKVRKAGGGPGSTRPYFHAAAPMNRRMIQSGVVGAEAYEGESDAQFTGKSGSQMYEASSSRTKTTSLGASVGGSIGPVNLGGSARRTTTDVSAERSVSQTVDTTSRQAAEERRELVSHHTKVENVLTLLTAKYVGTPHLNFSLWPQPLALLALDPSDPNLWYSQLVQRRSSGIEGVQEFTAVVLVPRDENFCINARLRRVCVVNFPPRPLKLEPFNLGQHVVRMLDYFDRVYPPGTQLDDLDVDLTGLLNPQPEQFIRPIIRTWFPGQTLVVADVVSPHPVVGAMRVKFVNYKHSMEAWLDAQRDEYERDVVRSPLEDGVILQEHLFLDTCFSFAAAGGLVVTGSSASATPMHRLKIRPDAFDFGGVPADARDVRADVRARAYEAVTRWNLLEQGLATLLSNRADDAGREPLRIDDPDLVNIMIETWSRFPVSDPRNLGFDPATKALHLTEKHRRLLKAAGATDLRSIAAVIRNAASIARHVERFSLLPAGEKDEAATHALPDLARGALSVAQADELRRAIGAGLQSQMPKDNAKP